MILKMLAAEALIRLSKGLLKILARMQRTLDRLATEMEEAQDDR